MSWFGFILVLVLICQSRCDRDEAKENQPNGFLPLFFQPFNPIQSILKDKNLENCHSPLCTFAQQFVRPDQSLASNDNLAHPKAPVLPERTEKCVNCPGPNCRCRPNHPSLWEQSLSLLDGISIRRQKLPFPIRVVCFLNRVGIIPSIHLTIACLFAEIADKIVYIIKKLIYTFRKSLTLLPFKKLMPGIGIPPYEPNVPNYPNYAIVPMVPIISMRANPEEPIQQPA